MPAKKRISSAHVPGPPPQTWSNCLVIGQQVFVAGMRTYRREAATRPNGFPGTSEKFRTLDR
jgi:hypothetical protein